MSTTPARLQFHLATVLCLTLLAGAWIGLNVLSERDFTGGPLLLNTSPDVEPIRLIRRSFGWPLPCVIVLYHLPDRVKLDQAPAGPYPAQGWRIEPLALFLDVLFFVVALGVVGVVLEKWKRDREKPAAGSS